MVPKTPAKLGRYDIVREIGRGAMGVVFLAKDPLIGRLVALKTFRPGFAADEAELTHFRSRFMREAQSAGILSEHPGIVTIHDIVWAEGDGPTFLAMEYVEGIDLKTTLRSGRPLEPVTIVDLVRQLADALDFAHSKGVVHRDIKPANIIVTPQGRAKITDFGVARMSSSNLTLDGQLLGTPNYMAPEQVQGLAVDHRADIFSLGVICYEMLTRQKPFQGENVTVVTHRIVYEDFIPPERHVAGLPVQVGVVLRRALAKRPEERYDRAGELAAELAQALGGEADAELDGNDTRVLPARSALRPEPPGAVPPPPLPSPPQATLPVAVAAAPASPEVTVVTGASTPAAAATPPPAAAKGLPPGAVRRLAWVGIPAALVVVAFGLGKLAQGAPGTVAAEPAVRRSAELAGSLQEGHRRLRDGDPAAAAVAFREAERLAPDRPRIRSLRQVAEAQATARTLVGQQAQEVEARLVEARAALESRRYRDAIAAAEAILAADPGQAEATAIRTEARRRLALRAERGAGAATEAAESAVPEAAPETAAPPPVADDRPARLTIEFIAERPEGTLIVAVDGQRIVDEAFSFFERSGLRRRPYRGQIQVPARPVAPGSHTFRIWVAEAGQAARMTELSGNFPGGVERRLAVRLGADGSITARLE